MHKMICGKQIEVYLQNRTHFIELSRVKQNESEKYPRIKPSKKEMKIGRTYIETKQNKIEVFLCLI